VCGSLEECPHDREDNDGLDSQPTSASAFGTTIAKTKSPASCSEAHLADGTYDMVSNAPILPYSEVFNTYGENLTNGQLLVRYGFSLDENENDCITWDWGDLWTSAARALYNEPWDISGSSGRLSGGADNVMQLYAQAINLWPSESSGWTETGLVYNPKTDTASTTVTNKDECADDSKRYPERALYDAVLCLNGDGRISHHLWLYCALLGHQYVVRATNSGVEEIVGQLREVASLLMQLEKEVSLDCSDDSHNDNDYGVGEQRGEGSAHQDGSRQQLCSPRTPIREVVAETVRTVLCLCRSRSARIGKSDLLNSSALDIGEELDRIPPYMTRTRKAMIEVLSEKSLLESVECAWSEIEKQLG